MGLGDGASSVFLRLQVRLLDWLHLLILLGLGLHETQPKQGVICVTQERGVCFGTQMESMLWLDDTLKR